MPIHVSAVMVTIDRFERLLPSLRRLAADQRAHDVEVVIVVTKAAAARVDPAELEAFASHRVVEHGPIAATGEALATGFRAASAPVIAVLEDHVFVRPGWVGGVLAAHEGPWGSVGHTMVNANPETAASWAALLTDFASVVAPVATGPDRPLGWHQASYKRDLVLARGPRLGALLETEGLLHAELAGEGHRTFLADDVEVAHANLERAGDVVRAALIGGRLFASRRAEHERMSALRKAVRVVGAPLVPILRTGRLARDIARVRTVAVVPRATLALGGAALVAHAAGEVLGYLLGAGDAVERKVAYELDRARFLAPGLMDVPPRAPSRRPPAPTPALPR